jgi:hypothetical protein
MQQSALLPTPLVHNQVGTATARETDPVLPLRPTVYVPAHSIANASHHGSRLLAVGLVGAAWGAAVWASAHVHPGLWTHRAALFVHLLSLVVGLGAVVVLDAYGAGCLLRRRSPVVVARLAGSFEPLIWTGLVGLTVSGTLLAPNLNSPLTWLKLGAVIIAGLNGINAQGLREAVQTLPDTTPLWALPRHLLGRLLVTTALSQAAWWIAVTIGYWNNLN